MDLSISIVCHNNSALIQKCLQSIQEQTVGIGYEVMVVDNASADDSVAMIRRNFPQVRIIENAQNLFFTRAHNQAIRAAKGDYVLVLNPDTIVTDHAVAKMMDYIRTHERIGALGCKLLNPDGSIQPFCGKYHFLMWGFFEVLLINAFFPDNFIEQRRRYPYEKLTDGDEVDYISGACMLMSKKALNGAGLFDERFLMYSEEVDLCYRIKHAGYRVCVLPSAIVSHIGGSSSSRFGRRYINRIRQNSMLAYFRKHNGVTAYAVLKVIDTFTFPLLYALKSIKRAVLPGT
jgi:GT2 family glycosyltransferase